MSPFRIKAAPHARFFIEMQRSGLKETHLRSPSCHKERAKPAKTSARTGCFVKNASLFWPVPHKMSYKDSHD